MTPAEMDEIDRRIAERIMGWHEVLQYGVTETAVRGNWWADPRDRLVRPIYDPGKWSPTRDGNDMLAIIEEMRGRGHHIHMDAFPDDRADEGDRYYCICGSVEREADTLPLAVCLAALEVVKQ